MTDRAVTPGVARRGRVERFDAEEGLGVVLGDDGRRYPFHCVAIADGSRTVPVGVAVTFVVRPGLPGQWEAQQVTPEEDRG